MTYDAFFDRAYAVWAEAERQGIDIPHTPDPLGRMIALATALGISVEMVLDPAVEVSTLFQSTET